MDTPRRAPHRYRWRELIVEMVVVGSFLRTGSTSGGGESVDKYNVLAELSSEEEGEEGGEKEDEDPVVEIVVTLPRPNDPHHPFDVFDMGTHTWNRQPTYGSPPSLSLGSTLSIHMPSHCFYLFGGWNEMQFDSEVYRISIDTWVWEKVQPATTVKPSPRYLTGVVVHIDRLCMFGGAGPKIVNNQDPGASYQPKKENGEVRDFGWNNEYYEFNLITCAWTAPLGRDAFRPHPIATFAFSKCDQQRAILFGGKGPQGYMNEAFVFHLEAREWSEIKSSGPAQPWPAKCRFGTLTPLIPPEMVGQRLCGCGPVLMQTMVLLWGKDNPDHICPETWLLDVETFTWVQINTGLKPRSWHIACAVYSPVSTTNSPESTTNSPVSTECRVVVFGGNMHSEGHFGDRKDTADLRVLSFGVKSLVRCCLAAIVESKELIGALPSLPPSFQKLITTAYEAHKNCPKSFPITYM